MIRSGSSPLAAIHVIPVALRSWNVMALRVVSLAKRSERSTPARAK
jgi:hypothetical protein